MENRRIIQPIDMTMAKHSFNVTEKRVIYRVLEQLQNKMDRNVVVRDLFGSDSKIMVEISSRSLLPDNSQNRAQIIKALKRLKSISFEVVGKNKKGVYDTTASIIKDFKYYRYGEIIDIEIDEDLKDYFLEKAKGFTRYNLEISFSSSSAYTMKLYEFLSHWRNVGEVVIKQWTLDYLCNYFNTPASYRRYSKFVEKILAPAESELNNNPNSDLHYSYAGVKKGRKYDRIVFTITDTATAKQMPHQVANQIVLEQALSSVLYRDFKFTKSDLAQIQHILANQTLHAEILETIDRVQLEMELGKVQYPKAYIKRSIANLL